MESGAVDDGAGKLKFLITRARTGGLCGLERREDNDKSDMVRDNDVDVG